ncbi:MAG: inner membrane-spanning protein YciB [Gammaproteobacteria bacterium]
MQNLFVFIPLGLFFAAYKFADIYIATMVLMASTTLMLGVERLTTGKVSKSHLYITGLLLVLGTITVLVRDPKFIQWKLSVVFWIFAAILLASQRRGKTPTVQALLQAALEEQSGDKDGDSADDDEEEEPLNLLDSQWRGLNTAWAGFFAGVGVLNLFIAYRFEEDFWVKFKVFGVFGLQLCFLILSMIWLFRASASNNAAAKATTSE